MLALKLRRSAQRVHTLNHFGPMLCFSAAGARVDGQDRTAAVVRAAQGQRKLALLKFGRDLFRIDGDCLLCFDVALSLG